MNTLTQLRFSARRDQGFTAIELMVVISVMAVLSTAAVGGISAALRQINVDRSAQAIEEAGRIARDLARRARVGVPCAEGSRYGMVVVDAVGGARAWVAVTYGATATAADILQDSHGVPVFRRELAKGAAFFAGADATTMDRLAVNAAQGLGWMYQYDTGLTTLRPLRHLVPTYIGFDAQRLTDGGLDPTAVECGPAYLALGDDQGTLRMAVSCQATGVTSTMPWLRP